VRLTTADGTAVSGSDYVAADTLVTFAPGETTKRYALTVNGDKIAEPDEWFGVRLTGAVGATIEDDFGTVTILNDDGAAMTAASAPAGDGSVETLSDEMLAAIVDAAITRWAEAIQVDERTLAALYEVSFQIVDFTGLTLGLTGENTIFIDADAAGYGWFIDQTPLDDAEFGDAEGEAAGRMDLLTVVMHELGHVLGYRDGDPRGGALMNETLEAGVRIDPSPAPGSGSALVRMDMSHASADRESTIALPGNPQKNPWLHTWLLNRGEDGDMDPNANIKLFISKKKAA
jgi:hypothetical protein